MYIFFAAYYRLTRIYTYFVKCLPVEALDMEKIFRRLRHEKKELWVAVRNDKKEEESTFFFCKQVCD